MIEIKNNITINPSIEINVKEYPVYFDRKNLCIHCGAENSLEFVDKFGNIAKTDIHPFEHFRCKVCGRNYSILWQQDESGKMYPSAIDMSIKREFTNLIQSGKNHILGIKKERSLEDGKI